MKTISTEEELLSILTEIKNKDCFKSPPDYPVDDQNLQFFIHEFAHPYTKGYLSGFCEHACDWDWDVLVEEVIDSFKPFELDEEKLKRWLSDTEKSHVKWLKDRHTEWYDKSYNI